MVELRMIETERLILRQNIPTDFDAFRAMYDDPEVVKHIGNGQPGTTQDSWFRFLRFIGHWSVLDYGFFAVIDKASGLFLGQTGLAEFRRGLGEDFDPYPEAGWMFVKAAHGQGYATEAARAAHEWFDARHGRQRTVCIIDAANAASIGVAEKLGYSLIGERPYRDEMVLVFERTP